MDRLLTWIGQLIGTAVAGPGAAERLGRQRLITPALARPTLARRS